MRGCHERKIVGATGLLPVAGSEWPEASSPPAAVRLTSTASF
ncbi:hypothetical protein RHECNPAF_2330011 [Rhizobium etli CNPAF512]|nr:hypothetical protein RHECNPAF_2330011 [Rhizobium etli CNPAF512]